MIICSCNVLSDQDVRSAVEAGRTRSISQVYGCLGCSPKCGRCVRGILQRLRAVLPIVTRLSQAGFLGVTAAC